MDEAAPGSGIVICPKCGRTQQRPDSAECSGCGVIFSKVRAEESRVGSPSVADEIMTYGPGLSDGRTKRVLLLGLLLVLSVAALIFVRSGGEIRHPPGVLVASEPEQRIIKGAKSWMVGRTKIIPMAQFRITARVLSTERYRNDATSDLSPIDLALGWGPMSDQAVLDRLDISQGDRFFMIAPLEQAPPLPIQALLMHSSNMHMIPAGKDVEKALFRLRVGDIIRLKGYLVGVQENGRWIWVSSLKRTDTGNGACEIVWVNEVNTQ